MARFGLGMPILTMHLVAGASTLLSPLTAVLRPWSVPLPMAGAFIGGAAIAIGGVGEMALR